jgi:phosphatidylglycerol:prolipoprotein diacylglycerol transferase
VPTSLHFPTLLGYIVINIDPIALQIGNIAIHWYGLSYVLAISIALWATLRYGDTLGVARQYVWNAFFWTALAGVIGGRLYFVIQQPDLVEKYLLHPINILAVWNGGMAFFGAIFLATPTAAYMSWKAGLSPFIAIDMGALFAAIGQMFVRLGGNLVNGDIVGYPVSNIVNIGNVCQHAPCIAYVSDPHIMPWATVYLHPGAFVPSGILYQPAAFYEILINLIALALLWPLRLILPRRIRAGAFFCVYLALYSLGQFFIFFTRANDFVSFLGITSLKQGQWTSLFTFLSAAILYALFRRFSKPWTHSQQNPVPLPTAKDSPKVEARA